MTLDSGRASMLLLAMHMSAVVAVAGYLAHLAIRRGFGVMGVAACLGALLAMMLVPRFPVVATLVFVAAAYGLPRYGQDQIAMLELGLLNWLALLALTGFLAWSVRRVPATSLALRLHWSLPVMAVFLAWAGVSLAVALVGAPETQFFARHHPAQLLQGAVLMLIGTFTLGSPRAALLLVLLVCVLPLIRAAQQGDQGLYLEADVAALCVIALPMALLGLRSGRPWWARAVMLALLLALLRTLWLAQNRGAIIGLAAVLLALWFNARFRWRWSLSAAALAALLALLVYVMGPSSYLKRFSVFWDSGASHATAPLDRATVEERKDLWRTAVSAISEHKLLGVGPGRETVAVAGLGAHGGSKKLPTHNSFLSVAIETGLVGLLLYSILFVGGVLHLQRFIRVEREGWYRDQGRMVQAALCGYLGVGLVISRYDMQLAYLLLGWAAALHGSAQARRPMAT